MWKMQGFVTKQTMDRKKTGTAFQRFPQGFL